MSGLLESVLTASPALVYVVVTALVFAEDAVFVGFLVPGETAAILGGVAASRGTVSLIGMTVAVVLAAIVGDSVGYEVGRHAGPRMLRARMLDRHRERIDGARSLLARRGSIAVFLGRSIAFFRAVMPALAGMDRCPTGGSWPRTRPAGWSAGVATVLLGFLAGNSTSGWRRRSAGARPSRSPPWSCSRSAPGRCAGADPSGADLRPGPVGSRPASRPPGAGRPAQPGFLDHLGQLLPGQLADPAGPQQHRRCPSKCVVVKNGVRLVLHQRLLVRLAADPEDDHVVVPLARLAGRPRPAAGSGRTRRLPPHLVDRPARADSSTVTNGIPPAISCTSRTRARLATGSH